MNGVLNPVTIFDGQVIDGWHRYTAANELSIECPTVELGDVDPRDFVLAQNRARRHVTQAQLALATTAVYAWKPVGNPTFSQLDTECPIGKQTQSCPRFPAFTLTPSNRKQKAVQTKAAPEVVEAVKRGEIGHQRCSYLQAAKKDQQVAAINKSQSGKKKPRTVEPLHLVTPTGEVLTAADMGADDPLEMLKEMQQDLEAAHKQIEILTQDDTKAELHKMILQRDRGSSSVRRNGQGFCQSKSEKRTKALLMRCGKAVGEDDPEKIPANG